MQSLQLFFVLCILQRINQGTFQEMFSHSKTYQNIADTDPWLGMSFLNKHDVILIPFILLLDSCCQPQWRKMPPHWWQLPLEVLCISASIGVEKKKKESVMHMLFKVCCILMRNAKVNMGQVALCQKSGQWRIRNFSGLTFLRSKAQARPSPLCCICFKIYLYSYK